MPAWATSDWPVAAVAALVLLGACVAVGIVLGVILAITGSAEVGSVVSGALTGAFLPFAMFGVETAALRVTDDTAVIVALKTLPIPLVLVAIGATWVAMGFAWRRVGRTPERLLAFVVKLALVVTLIAAVAASLLSIGDSDDSISGFVSEVSGGNAAFYPFLIVGAAGVAFLLRRRVPIAGGRVNRVTHSDWARGIFNGFLAFAACALVLSVLVLLTDIITGDDGKERLSALAQFFVTGVNKGIAAVVFAMGGAIERLGSHTSLFHWGSYESPGDGNAPAPLFLLLALVPLAIGYLTTRALDRDAPTDEQGVLRVAGATALGFVVTSWMLSLLAREMSVFTSGDSFLGGSGVAENAGSPRAAFGLGLVWALVGAGGAAMLWSQRHGVRWQVLQAQNVAPEWDEGAPQWDAPDRYAEAAPAPDAWAEPGPGDEAGYGAADDTVEYRVPVDPPAPDAPATWTPAPPPPVESSRARARACPACGTAVGPERFCRTCGHELRPA